VSLDGLDPSGSGTREYWIEKDLLQFFYKKGLLHKFHSAKLVKELLTSPAVIFEVLEQEGQEAALCYAGLASCRYTNEGHQVPAPKGKTFAVYIRSDDVIVGWDWELADDNLTYPQDYRERFGKQLWPTI
jgi:hypothetical protein